MLKLFSPENDNKAFISIKTENTIKTLNNILKRGYQIELAEITNNEILLNLPESGYNFSLNQLRAADKNSRVDMFNLFKENNTYKKWWYSNNRIEIAKGGITA